MGINDSSKTRVVPVFDLLFERDRSGESWLPVLLTIGSRSRPASAYAQRAALTEGHGRTWGVNEQAFPAPLALLEYLAQRVTEEQVASCGDTGVVLEKRKALAKRDPDTIEEALRELRTGRRGRHWFVLEGPSRPDATFEMREDVLVIEGKRTERSCTCKTKWMERRSQLLRHMDCALEMFPGKRVCGLLLVEGGGGADALVPSPRWLKESAAQYSREMLDSSLPHRSQELRQRLADAVLGVATWQSVCARTNIPWPPYVSSAR